MRVTNVVTLFLFAKLYVVNLTKGDLYIMGMFDNFTPTTISCNRPKYIYDDNSGELVIGATNTHIFNVPFLLSEFTDSFEIIYRQGIEVVLVLNSMENNGAIDVEEDEEKEYSIVTVTLNQEMSNLFKNSVLECQAQMKLYMQDGTTLYSDSYDINVKSPLDNENAV